MPWSLGHFKSLSSKFDKCIGFIGSPKHCSLRLFPERNLFLSEASTATHHPPSRPACQTRWWTISCIMPSKLGATWPPWPSIKWQEKAGTSKSLLTACSIMTGTLLMGRAAPWPMLSSPAWIKWRATHTLMIMRSGVTEVFTRRKAL